MTEEEKLKKKFKKQIAKYQSWCVKYGYDSRNPWSLLWFYNQKKNATRIAITYYIVDRGKQYDVLDIISIFQNGEGKRK